MKTNTSFFKKIGKAFKKRAVNDIVSTSLKAVKSSEGIDKNTISNAHIQATTNEITNFILSVADTKNKNETSNTEKKNKTPKQLQKQYNFLRSAAEQGSDNSLSRIMRTKTYNIAIASKGNKIDFPHVKDVHVKIKNNELFIAHATKKSKNGYIWVPLDEVIQRPKLYTPMTKEQIKKFNSTPHIRDIITDVINEKRHSDEKQGDLMEKILHKIDNPRSKGKEKKYDDMLSIDTVSTADMSDDDYSRK